MMSIDMIKTEYIKLHKNRIEKAKKYYKDILGPWILENINEYCDTEYKFFSHRNDSTIDFNTLYSHFDGLKAIGINIRHGPQTCHNILTIVISIF